MNIKKRLGLGVLFLAILLAGLAVSVPALAGGGNGEDSPPGQDPCSHGNSGKPCRPDPQPTHGKDCEDHGNNGGDNEDHCAGGETTSTTPTTPTTPTTTVVVTTPSCASNCGNTTTVTGPSKTETAPTITVTVPGPTKVVSGKTKVVIKRKVIRLTAPPKAPKRPTHAKLAHTK